jgi:8-oxo-dGTP pyrophosphatase MutT (NUDIX family)
MPFHPRLDNMGKTVQILTAHTPSPLPSWADHCQVATVVPDGSMPYRLNHVLFRPWKKAPTTRPEWQDLSKWLDIEDPPFEAKGLKPAAGAVVVEPDGRVWLVAPTNAFGGSKATFPKGQANGLDLRATALKEVFEEAGLRIEIITHLIDVTRSTTRTRYFLARRTGGYPADMCWESQAVLLAPVEDLRSLLNKPVDHQVLAALLEWMGGWAGYFHKGKPEPDLADCKRGIAPARRAHWPTLPLPRARTTITLDIHLDEAEAACLRLGFIPSVMEEKWFAFMEGDTLYEHRSWTGYCIDQVHFVPEGDGLKATHAEVNRYQDQYHNVDDEEDRESITSRVNQLAHMTIEGRNTEDGFVTALKASMVPNYLGSPEVVQGLLDPFFMAIFQKRVALTKPNQDGLQDSYREISRLEHLVTKVFAGEDPDYGTIGTWHTPASLGAEAIKGFDLDPDYLAGENLYCILSEGIAALGMKVDELLKAFEQDPFGDLKRDILPKLAETRQFAASVLMGTRSAIFQDKTLKDFIYSPSEEC